MFWYCNIGYTKITFFFFFLKEACPGPFCVKIHRSLLLLSWKEKLSHSWAYMQCSSLTFKNASDKDLQRNSFSDNSAFLKCEVFLVYGEPATNACHTVFKAGGEFRFFFFFFFWYRCLLEQHLQEKWGDWRVSVAPAVWLMKHCGL